MPAVAGLPAPRGYRKGICRLSRTSCLTLLSPDSALASSLCPPLVTWILHVREKITWSISNWLDINFKTTGRGASHQPGWSDNLQSLNRARLTSLNPEKPSFVHMSKTIMRRWASEAAIVVLVFWPEGSVWSDIRNTAYSQLCDLRFSFGHNNNRWPSVGLAKKHLHVLSSINIVIKPTTSF